LAAAIGFFVNKYYETWQGNRARLHDKKREVYFALVKPWGDIIALKKREKPSAEIEHQFDLILYGSDEVIKEYLAFEKFARKEREKIADPAKGDDVMVAETFSHMAFLLKTMRKDLGHTFTKLDEADILDTFIPLNDEIRAKLKNVLRAP